MDLERENINRQVTEIRGILSGAERYDDRQDERYCGGSWQLQKPAGLKGREERTGGKSERPAPPL